MQHFWITKKTMQRKLGTKEDEYIISSDAELDSKIEIFKSITDTNAELSRIIEQYQDRLCILSQEECGFGRFLKEAGKRSKTTGQSISNTGKTVTYCGQQRMCVRVPLLRLQHEVDIFRNRAIVDTQNTLSAMEKERTEYRAALEWMKSSSSELDPDTGRGVDKFRTSQSKVRASKQIFDTLSMDSIQKIDLLAAARCNMFSHVLLSYMTELKQFAQKTSSTFNTISKALDQKPKYDFCVLKELTQHEGAQEDITNNTSFDNDQALFFATDYADNTEENTPQNLEHTNKECKHVTSTQWSDNVNNSCIPKVENGDIEQKHDFIDIWQNTHLLSASIMDTNVSAERNLPKISKELKNWKVNSSRGKTSCSTKNFSANPWIELFSELDPLANLEAFDLKLNGNGTSSEQT
ncbi:islet cell autoantigen 1-like protein [Haematobia irritans]|uniref:islet cell autoantigen 1-like protein n=1 Tax=Haematobia irritans TaxID=7368 RepID=UPI003F4FA78E